MRSTVLGLGLALVLAGCSGGPSEAELVAEGGKEHEPDPGAARQGPAPETGADEPPPEEVVDTGPRALHFEGEFQLMLTHVFVEGANGFRLNTEKNCVSFGKNQVWLVLNGTAEATWTPSGPFASRMTIDVRDVGPVATNNGSASPSLLSFGRFHAVPNAALGLIFVVQPSDSGAVYQQQVKLRLSFNYLGNPELETKLVPCVYQTAFEEEN